MSKTSDYWKMRELENRHRQQTLDFLDAYNKQIDDIYKYMLSTVQKEIDAFYGKYASDEGITMAEAKKRAAQLDIEAYAKKAKRYVANKTFTKKANAEMKLYNLTMKVNRLELLKSNMGLELVNGFDDLEKLFGDTLTAEGVKEFRRQAGILGETIVKDDEDRYKRLSDRMARASFHNATFSDRIWMHQDLLKGELNKALQQALISGASMERLARNIRNAFGASTKNAQRLMRTEIRRMQTDVAMESYKRNGNEEYKYMALGRRPCEACRELDGNVYKVKKMEVGLNAPPMHPNCMCSTAPYVDEKAYQEWLDSFDNHGLVIDNLGEKKYNRQRNKFKAIPYERYTEPMTKKHVKKVMNEMGVSFGKARIILDNKKEFIGKGLFGFTNPNGKEIVFYPDAFMSREELVKTIGHEKVHHRQIQIYGPSNDTDMLAGFEKEARASEEKWWNDYLRRHNYEQNR